MPKFAELRLLGSEILQWFLFFECNYEWRSVLKHFFPDFEDILDDFDTVAGLQPEVLLRAVQDYFVGEGREGELLDGVDGESAFEVAAVEQVEWKWADSQGHLIPLLGTWREVDSKDVDYDFALLQLLR